MDILITIISAFGPFIAAAITGLIAIIVVRVQRKTTLNAAKTQSEATIFAMSKSIDYQAKTKRIETIHAALSDLIMNLYLIERNSTDFFNDHRPTFSAIAKLQTILSFNERDLKIKGLLIQLMDDFIKRGDVSNVARIRAAIVDEASSLISEIGK